MMNGWFFGAAAPADATPEATPQATNQTAEGHSDSDGEFVVVDGHVGRSVSTRAGDSVLPDSRLKTDTVEDEEVANDEQSITTSDKDPDDIDDDLTMVDPIQEDEEKQLNAAVGELTVTSTSPCPATQPDAVFVAATLPSPTQEEEVHTEVDTELDDEPTTAVPNDDNDEVTDSTVWVDTNSQAKIDAPVLPEDEEFKDCCSKAIFNTTSSSSAASSSPAPIPAHIYAWGCPGMDIVIADVDVAEQEVLSELLSTGAHRTLAEETVMSVQVDAPLSPQQQLCLSLLVPPASTANQVSLIHWNINSALQQIEDKLKRRGVVASSADDIRELMVLHSLLSRVSSTPDPSHHIAIASLLIRQSRLEEGGVLEAAPILRQLRKAVDEGFNRLDMLCGDDRFNALHGFAEFDGFISDALEDWEPVLKVQSMLNHRGSNAIKICDILSHLFHAGGDEIAAAASIKALYS